MAFKDDFTEEETHPAFGVAILNRASAHPGWSLFDSEIRHQHFVTLRICTAGRERGLNRDWIHARKELIEIQMSEAQWGALVSSMGIGGGVPVTIAFTEKDGAAPAAPFAPRMEMSTKEVTGAAQKIFEDALKALEIVEDKPTKANLRDLRRVMEQAHGSVKFAAQSLAEFTETTVARAKSDIEAMMLTAAQAVGLKDPRFVGPEIGAKNTEDKELEQ